MNNRPLLALMVRRELAARTVGTAGGVGWLYAQPLLTVAAYFLVFDVVFAMRLGDSAPTSRVGAYLVVGSVPWMAFCDAISRGMHSLLEAGTLLKKNALPPALFPLKSVLASGLIYLPLIALLVPVYAGSHGWGMALMWLPVLLVTQCLLCICWAHVLAILAAALRDTVQVVGFALSVGIFLSPILFPIQLFPADWRWTLWANPMTAWVSSYQAVLLGGQAPAWADGLAMLAWLVAGALALWLLERRSRDHLVDWL